MPRATFSLPRGIDVKTFRERLTMAQSMVLYRGGHPDIRAIANTIQSLIIQCDEHRPLRSDGTHGERLHTETCGCADKGNDYYNSLKDPDPTEISDGFHTMQELYDFRRLYHAYACRAWYELGYPVVKSERHSDTELCFGGGWFIVTAQLPTGQVSNHYELEHWTQFRIPEVEFAPAFDGHTTADVASRLEKGLELIAIGTPNCPDPRSECVNPNCFTHRR